MSEEKVQAKNNDILTKVVEKIDNASNILVAVSKDPTVDELAAALGLTMMLDNIGKHATAIYSGETPNMLKFLNPEKTFESNTNSLQDFIIALDKEKADHLRYKVDGEFVKVFITPYKTTIDEGDLEFSHGDYNVDLVIALGVQTADDLDAALYEHGKILHDAGSINITDETPGEFAEIEWNEPGKSSVSEMVSDLAYAMKDKVKLDKTIATALLTGIIAKTDRFSNDETTPKTMDVAAKLMEAGANQKQISENIEEAEKADEEKEENELEVSKDEPKKSDEALDLDKLADEAAGKTPAEKPKDETQLDVHPEGEEKAEPEAEPAADESATEPAVESEPALDSEPKPELTPEQQLDQLVAQPTTSQSALDELQKSASQIYPSPQDDVDGMNKGDTVPEPTVAPTDYGQMMEEALAEPLPNPAAQATPQAPTGPELNHIPDMEYVPHAQTTPVTLPQMEGDFLAAPATEPTAPAMPEMSGTPGAPVMPEAPAMPAVPTMPVAPVEGMSEPVPQPIVNPAPMPEMPAVAEPVPAPAMPEMPAPEAPAMPEVPAADANAQFMAEPQPLQPDLTASQLEQANDPSAFKIPGM